MSTAEDRFFRGDSWKTSSVRLHGRSNLPLLTLQLWTTASSVESHGRRLPRDSMEQVFFFRCCNVFPGRNFFASNLKRLHHSTTKNKQSTIEKQLRTLVDKYHTKAEHKHNQNRQKSHSTSTRTEKTHQNGENAHRSGGNAGERKQKGRMKKKVILIRGSTWKQN